MAEIWILDHISNMEGSGMLTGTARVTQGGRLVIPSAIRKALGLREGALMVLQVEGKAVRMMAIDDQIDAAQALFGPLLGPGAVDAFLAERRREADREVD
jgi:AbrB family looped-hinge helix DNA binding protein